MGVQINDPNFDQYDAQSLPGAIEVFLKEGGDVNGMYEHKFIWTKRPLYFAVLANSAPAVRLLLSAGADPNSTGDMMTRPLHVATYCDSPDTVEIATLLLDHGADLLAVDYNGDSPIHMAFRAGNSRLVDLLLARFPKGVNPPNLEDLTLFHIACAHGADQLVRDLLDSGVPIDEQTEDFLSGLKFAVMYNRSTVELLLQRGANVRSESLLHLACETNLEKFVAQLTGQCVEMRDDMEVSERDHLGIINLLLDHGVDVNETNSSGLTPLLYLCTDRVTNTINWRISLTFPNECTMVREHQHMIARRRLIAQCLLERGAAIDARSPDGSSLLHLEFECNFDRRVPHDHGIMELFVKYGADVNARDKRQFTPLHVNFDHVLYPHNSTYSYLDDRKIVLLLLHGADVNARSADGLTPVALFIKNFYGNEKELRKCSRLKIMLAHAQRLMLLGQTVDDEIRAWIKRLDLEDLRSKEKQYIKELAQMKVHRICGSSVYRMLITGLNGADQCVSEKKLRHIVQDLEVAKKYPNFAYLLELMVRRAPLLKGAESALKIIAKFELPYLCTKVIFKNLVDTDLRNLAEVTRIKRKLSDCESVEPSVKKQRVSF